MPMRDAGLAELPAEIDRLVLANRGKVDEAEIDILHDASVRFDPVDQPADFVLELRKARSWQRRAHAGESRAPGGLGVMQGRIRL